MRNDRRGYPGGPGPTFTELYQKERSRSRQVHDAAIVHYPDLDDAVRTAEEGLDQFNTEVDGLSMPEELQTAQETAVQAVAALRRVLDRYRPSRTL